MKLSSLKIIYVKVFTMAFFCLTFISVYAQDAGENSFGNDSETQEVTSSQEDSAPETDSQGFQDETSETDSGESSETSSDEEGEESSSDSGGDTSAKPTFGLGFDLVEINGQTWNRIRFFPVLPVGKFQFAFDVELFINNEGTVSDKGWNFDTPQDSWETISRKIYFISFDKKRNVTRGDNHFYFKIGAIERTTLGWGLIMKDYCNVLNYPAHKALGLEFALGNISDLKFGMNMILNDFGEMIGPNKGAVLGGQIFFNPLGKMDNLLGKLKISMNYVADINQYAGAKDRDGDYVPDSFDKFPDNENLSTEFDEWMNAEKNANLVTKGYITRSDVKKEYSDEPAFSLENRKDFFGIFGADLTLPLIYSKPANLDFYFQYALNTDKKQTHDQDLSKGWGIAPGVNLELIKHIFINFEYRHFANQFRGGWFNYNYDNNRVRTSGSSNMITLDNMTSGDDSSSLNGIFGTLSFDLFVVNIEGTYEHLFSGKESFSDEASFEAKAGLGSWLSELLTKSEKFKIDNVEAFFIKSKIDPTKPELFFEKDPSVRWGAALSVILMNNLRMFYTYETTYLPESLEEDTTFNMGTELVF